MKQETIQPHLLDAEEWRHQAQGLAVAALRLADSMAADYGQELKLLRPPEVPAAELRYVGNPYRVGGGLDDPRREPPLLHSARRLAQETLAMERQIDRMIQKTLDTLPEPDKIRLAAQLAAPEPPPAPAFQQAALLPETATTAGKDPGQAAAEPNPAAAAAAAPLAAFSDDELRWELTRRVQEWSAAPLEINKPPA